MLDDVKELAFNILVEAESQVPHDELRLHLRGLDLDGLEDTLRTVRVCQDVGLVSAERVETFERLLKEAAKAEIATRSAGLSHV